MDINRQLLNLLDKKNIEARLLGNDIGIHDITNGTFTKLNINDLAIDMVRLGRRLKIASVEDQKVYKNIQASRVIPKDLIKPVVDDKLEAETKARKLQLEQEAKAQKALDIKLSGRAKYGARLDNTVSFDSYKGDIPFADSLRGRPINAHLNDFLVEFLGSHKGGGSSKDINKAWQKFASKRHIPARETISSDIVRSSKQLIAVAMSDPKVFKDLSASRKSAVHFQYHGKREPEIGFGQQVLESRDRTYLFTDRSLGDKQAASVASRLVSSAGRDITDPKEQVVFITPDGPVHTIVDKKQHMVVSNGNRFDQAHISPLAAGLAYTREHNEQLFTESLAKKQTDYHIEQLNLRQKAYEQMKFIATQIAAAHTGDIGDFKNLTVGELKQMSESLASDAKEFIAYKGFSNDTKIAKALSSKDYVDLQFLNKQAIHDKSELVLKGQLKPLVKLLQARGIDEEAAIHDIEKINNNGSWGYDMELTDAGLNAIEEMSAHLASATPQEYKRNKNMREALLGKSSSTRIHVLGDILKHSSDHAIMKARGLDSYTSANPMLNLEGTIASKIPWDMGEAVFRQALELSPKPIDPDMLRTWGSMLTDRGPRTLKASINHALANYAMSFRHSDRVKRNKYVYKSEMKRIKENLASMFGGSKEIGLLEDDIRAFHTGVDISGSDRDLRVATEAFASGESYSDQELNKESLGKFQALRAEQSEQLGQRAKDVHYMPEDGTDNLLDLSLDELKSRAELATWPKGIEGIKGFDRDKLRYDLDYLIATADHGYNVYDLKEMNQLAGMLGVDDYLRQKGKKTDSVNSIKDTVKFLKHYRSLIDNDDSQLSDARGSTARINITKTLAKDIFKQTKEGYTKDFGSYDPKLVRYLGKNTADWAPLFESQHGDLTGLQLLIGGDAGDIRPQIVDILEHMEQPPEALGAIKDFYKGTHIATNIDENILAALRDGEQFNPNTGRMVVTGSAMAELDTILDPLTKLIGFKPMKANRAKQYFGRKTFFAANGRLAHKSSTTTYNKRKALNYLSDAGFMQDFQKTGSELLPNKDALEISKYKFKHNLKNFNKVQSEWRGTKINKRAQREKLASLNKAMDLVYERIDLQMTTGKYQSAVANLIGLDGLRKDMELGIKNPGTKKAAALNKALAIDGVGALNTRQLSGANKYFTDTALKSAIRNGMHISPLGELYNTVGKFSSGLNAQNILSKELTGANKFSSLTIDEKIKKFTEAGNLIKDSINTEPAKPRLRDKLLAHEVSAYRANQTFKSNIIPWAINKPVKQHLTYATKWDHRYPGFVKPVRFKKDATEEPSTYRSFWTNTSMNPIRRKTFEQPSPEEIADSLLRYSNKFTGFNRGGKIPGKGTKDEVPAILTKGEVVIDRGTSEKLGIHTQADYNRFKEAANNGTLAHFNDGGAVQREFQDAIRGFGANLDKEIITNLRGILDKVHLADDIDESFKSYAQTEFDKLDAKFKAQTVTPETKAGKTRSVTDIPIDDKPADSKPFVDGSNYDSKGHPYWQGIDNVEITAQNLVADVNKGQLNVEAFDSLSKAAKDAMLKDNSGGIDELQLYKAKTILNNRSLAKAFGMSESETNMFHRAGNTRDKFTTADIPEETKAKFAALSDAVYESGKQYASAAQNRAFRALNKETFSGSAGAAPDPTRRLAAEASVLKEVLGLDFSGVRTTGDVKDVLKGFNFDTVKVTGGYSTNRMRRQENALGVLDHTMGTDEFIGHEDQRAGVQNIKQKIQGGRSLRENAERRYTEFAALTMQNAAFGASYAVLGGAQQLIGGTVGFIANFDDSLKNLQAITGETSDGLDTMSDAVKRVSVQTKFSALEITDAATILGQAGFSSTDIDKSLGGVVRLATATGSGLEESTQVLTSALTIWDNSIADSTKYANQFTAAVNDSKLDINSLALTLQYAGNIAAQANIPVEDVTTMTSLLKNAGIKRGSTLGTGQRLLFSDIANPSKKFAESLKTVGISLATFNEAFKDKGLYGALKLMKESGYGLAQASKGMELREKSIYTAAINQLDQFQNFRESITNTDASYIANKTQMQSLGNSFKNMVNSWQINLNESFTDSKAPLVKAIKGLTIDVAKQDPTKALTTKNVTMQKINEPEQSNISLLQGGVALGAAAYLSRQNFPKSIKKMPAYVDTFISKTLDELGAKGKMGALVKKVVSSPLLRSPAAYIGAAGIGLSAYERYNQKEGSRGADFSNDLMNMGALAIGERASRGMSGLKKLGTMGAVATTVMFADKVLLKPARDSESDLTRAAGYAGSGAALGAGLATAAPFLLSNPVGWATTAALVAAPTIAGGIFGYSDYSKREAPKADATETMAKLSNNMKALTSEVGVLNKGAENLRSLSNFAMRSSKSSSNNANALERASKEALVKQTAYKMNGQLQMMEAALSSHGEFSGFNFGDKLSRNKDNSYNYQEFTANGTDIKSVVKKYSGDMVDALAASLSSAQEAYYKAASAKGGIYETSLAKVNASDMSTLQTKLADQKNSKDVVATAQSEGIKPLLDLVKTAPALAIASIKQLKDYSAQVDKVTLAELDDRLLNGSSKDAKDNLMASALYRKAAIRRDNQITSQLSTAASRATTVEEVNDITTAHLTNFLKTHKFTTLEDAKKAFGETIQGISGKAGFIKTLKESSGINSLLNDLSIGRTKLDQLDTKGIEVIRGASNAGAKSISTSSFTNGAIMTQTALKLSGALVDTNKALEHSLKTQVSTLGDISALSNEAIINRGESISTSGAVAKHFKDYLAFKPKGTKEEQAKQILAMEDKISVNTKGLVSLNKANLFDKSLKQVQINLVDTYKRSKILSDKLSSVVYDITSLKDPRASNDIGIYKSVENLSKAVQKAGFKDLSAAKKARENPYTREQIKAMSLEDLGSIFSPEKVKQFNDSLAAQTESINLHTAQAKELLNFESDFSRQELDIQSKQAGERLRRRKDYSLERAAVNYGRSLREIGISAANARTKAYTDYGRKLNSLHINYARQVQAINLNSARNAQDLQINIGRKLEDLTKNVSRAFENLDVKKQRGLRDIEIKRLRGGQDISLSRTRGLEDVLRQNTRGLEDLAKVNAQRTQDLNTQQTRKEAKLRLDTKRQKEDLVKINDRRIEDLKTKEKQAREDLIRRADRQQLDLGTKRNRGLADLATTGARGREDIGISGARGREDINLNYKRSLDRINTAYKYKYADLTLSYNRNLQDISTATARRRADVTRNYNRGIEDNSTKIARALADALTNFNDNVASLSRNYANNLAAIERSRSDTIDAFNRSLEKPQVVSINPESLGVIANNLGDVSLALDAHKAALTNNTTAVKQNTAIQKTSEDLAKEAYKEAYKKVGGKVHNADGTVNQDFLDAYQNYMNNNSDKLIDTVVNNAVDAAMAGGSFDITKALQDGSYMADQVSNPEVGVSTDAARAGYTDTELTQGLYGIKAGEVRVSSTAGIILDAKGGMEGAQFDLESAMIQIGIKLRELTYSYQNSLTEASIAYQNNLRDIEEANSRNLEDLETQFSRQLEDVSINASRQAYDANLAFQRALEDLAEQKRRDEEEAAQRRDEDNETLSISIARAGEDLALKLTRAGEDLDLSFVRAGEDLQLAIARAGEDLDISMQRAGEALTIAIARANEDLAINLTRAGEDLTISLGYASEDLAVSMERANQSLTLSMQRATEDLNISLDRAGVDLATNLTRAGEDLRLSIADAGEDIRIQQARAMEDITTSLARGMADIATQRSRALEDAATALAYGVQDAGIALRQALSDIGIQEAQQRAAATRNYQDALEDIKSRYEFDKQELAIATEENKAKIERGIAKAFDKIDLSNSQAIDNLNQQLKNQTAAVYQSLSSWAIQQETEFKKALAEKQWNLTGSFLGLETQINAALNKLKVDGDQILKSIAAGFRADFSGDKLKQVTDLTSKAVGDIFKKAFSTLDVPIATTVKKLSTSLKSIYDKKLSNDISSMTGLIQQDSKKIADSISTASSNLSNLSKLDNGIKSLAGVTAVLDKIDLATPARDLNNSIAEVTGVASTMHSTSSALFTAASGLSQTVSASGSALNSAVASASTNMATATYTFANTFVPIASLVVGAAQQAAGYIANAIASIRAALAASQSTHSSVGGRVGTGYGGGDTEPYMLEPGEYVVRKEIVRAKGTAYFENLNSGISNDNVQVRAMGLPSEGSSGNINVNIGVNADVSLDTIQNNMDQIADGVKRVFEEYN